MRSDREKVRDPQLEAAVQSMETAYRMQTEAPEIFDLRKESPATLKMYGVGSTARGCLLAVRLVQSGVRMVQVYYAKGDPWDAHVDIEAHRKNAKDSDQPFAAVIKGSQGPRSVQGHAGHLRVRVRAHSCRGSRRRRGPHSERARSQSVRVHHVATAGGGVKGGTVYGATDEFGFKAVEKPVHVHDLHATILHLMGIDHTQLTYRYSGRDFRLTDVAGNVVKDIIA